MNSEDLVLSRIHDLTELTRKRKSAVHSQFMSAGELCAFSRFNVPHDVVCTLWGGYPNAERRCVLVYPDFICPESDAEFSELAEIDILYCRNTAGAELSHRDYLGALMSLGIERKTLGDILTHEDEAVIFLKKSITPYVLENLDKVSNTRLKIDVINNASNDFITKFAPKKEERIIIIPSLRIDCIIAEVYSLSRTEAQRIVTSGMVRLNHADCLKTDKLLFDGDTVSVSGKGRFQIGTTLGTTKKDNLRLSVFVYV